ncbi:DUF3093 domain-containing protein [Actinokineospora bangkokensis]|uniref:DUF3093 domain-containing protein n=1 Tax=Actinokineospora bangkokensis TaxID=1193682 RepID=A0A1Q9LSF0_9PSEU|nr:DUF3093 domain-containing protein [Actinokineospora bangkokensis]OLR94939.1 hypothetical protein BJP25_08165 [Actinokineospora bangkokensis]
MDDTPGATRPAPTYAERLHVTWYWWPLPLLAAGLLAAEVHMGYPGVRAWLPYAIVLPLTLLMLWRAGRTPVAVRDGKLLVADANLPLEHVGEVVVVAKEHKRRVLGPHLDPAAHVVHRGWVGPLVRVVVEDPEDSTPYWLFSTRHPEQVAEALRTGAEAARSTADR